MKKLCSLLFENLGEEYPHVLSSILKALFGIITYLPVEHTDPPIEELLPSLTPILRNRNENVQLYLVCLIGKIAA